VLGISLVIFPGRARFRIVQAAKQPALMMRALLTPIDGYSQG
jgi:hypothetical protein